VFTRSGSTWTQQEKLTVGGESPPVSFGTSVALSGDGNTALIGGASDEGKFGYDAVWVFTRSGSTWTQQETLTHAPPAPDFGAKVALASDGTTALIGGPGGAVWVYTRSGSTWTQQGETLTGGGDFGDEVALSSDGNTALIAAPNENEGRGAAWVYTRSGSTWTQQGEKLTILDENPASGTRFGGVALSSDGNTALIGGPNGYIGGYAWVFTRSGSTWTRRNNVLFGTGGSTYDAFGASVALSSGGTTALVGGPYDNERAGAAWVFTAPRYYYNGVPVGSEPKTVIEWGTLTFKATVGGTAEVTCHTVQAGTIQNPAGGTSGIGSTQVFATFDCESTTCPYTSVVTAESLPWGSLLEGETGVLRSKTVGMKIKIDCQKEGKSEGSETFVGATAPSARHGTSALHPGLVEYDAGAGTLEQEGSKGGALGKLEGEVKVLGYDEQELINVN
jgi:hypothetical protein